MKERIKSVIVDDEQKSILSLQRLIHKYCPGIEVIDTAKSVGQAIGVIENKRPDLVFLDIALPDGDGFDVLMNFDFKGFEVIFITASDKFAIRAFEFSAIHYLLKPIDYLELQKAIERYEKIKNVDLFSERINILRDSIDQKPTKIILPTAEGLNVIDLAEIIRCEADDNYTTFYFSSKKNLIVSKSLSNFEKLLSGLNFSRIHNKHLINLKHIKKYIKGKSGYVIMNDNTHVYVSESRRNNFVKDLKEFACSL